MPSDPSGGQRGMAAVEAVAMTALRVVWTRLRGEPMPSGELAPDELTMPRLVTPTTSYALTFEEADAYERAGVPSEVEP
jgi:hypothetical protein